MQHPTLYATNYTWININLAPRKAGLVAVLKTETQRVGYADTILLKAGESYDPDRAQVREILMVWAQFIRWLTQPCVQMCSAVYHCA